ncbi:uncharacterized protein LOC131149059 isoform X6 [Malania oleifera]|uniref:uncharacterized protein LOC131149059 isoform X6 n=1 Tax=Malania oleifera TaxID=397392 RepID=UPI0025AE7F23|nr:uncharacterized protein LOC131149059 isoform X6 [Malania oleifera]
MKKYKNGEIWNFEQDMALSPECSHVILGVDGGTTSTVCVCMRINPFADSGVLPKTLPVLARAVAGCSNHNSVGGYLKSFCSVSFNILYSPETAARETLELVMADALSKSALASGTMGRLHGCVLIAGTGTIAYGFTEDGREARAAGAGPVLGDWGSGYGIAAQALTAVIRSHDGRGPPTKLTNSILQALGLSSPDELIRWTYADPSWARIAALVPVVVSCAEEGDLVADKILLDSVQELAASVKAVVRRLGLCGEGGEDSFPLVMVGGVLKANERWDIGKEVINCVVKDFPGALPIRPKVEPAVGGALVAWNFWMKESHNEVHKS